MAGRASHAGAGRLDALGTMPADTRVKIIVTAIIAAGMLVGWRSWREPFLVCCRVDPGGRGVHHGHRHRGPPAARCRPARRGVRRHQFPVGSRRRGGGVCAIAIVIFERTRNRWVRAITVVVAVGAARDRRHLPDVPRRALPHRRHRRHRARRGVRRRGLRRRPALLRPPTPCGGRTSRASAGSSVMVTLVVAAGRGRGRRCSRSSSRRCGPCRTRSTPTGRSAPSFAGSPGTPGCDGSCASDSTAGPRAGSC